jgi:hypothetical protein
MRYFQKYSFFSLLIFFVCCTDKECPAVKTAHEKKWDKIKTSARPFPVSGLWLHRTNTPAKFSKYADAYPGFEMDIVVDSFKMIFDVRHPPVPSQNIKLEDFLQLKEATGKYFWFDCKNLTEQNAGVTLKILNQLDSLFQIKNRIVFESTNAKALLHIAKAGYYCFYCLPINPEADICNDPALTTKTASLIDTSFTAISADGRMIPMLNKLFPNCRKATWSVNPVRNLFQNEQQKMLKDSMIQIVLTGE